MTSARDDHVTFYDAVGGEEAFTRLTRRFYEGVAADPALREMYPESDLGPAEERLRLFLIQYWGGPRTYNELRGHPRLRMRHMPFRIGAAERDRWLAHMRAAVDDLELPAALETQLWEYMVYAAHSMVNVPEEVERPARQQVANPTGISVAPGSEHPESGSGSASDDDGDEPITISLK